MCHIRHIFIWFIRRFRHIRPTSELVYMIYRSEQLVDFFLLEKFFITSNMRVQYWVFMFIHLTLLQVFSWNYSLKTMKMNESENVETIQFKGIGGVRHFFTCWSYFIEYNQTNSPVLTVCQNSMQFLRYRDFRVPILGVFGPKNSQNKVVLVL